MGGVESFEAPKSRGGRLGKIDAPLDKKLSEVKWGEFSFKSVFNKIVQGRRLKKDDQLPGDIPFVMAGAANTGVVNYISNPVSKFPKNSITVDIFGNAFYRDYDFGAGDDTGVYWNDEITYSKEAMLFFTISMGKALLGKFSFGNKLRSSQSLNLKMQLPISKNGKIDFDFISSFIAELEAERIKELEAYLKVAGFTDYVLNGKEEQALASFDKVVWNKYKIGELLEKAELGIKNKAFNKKKDLSTFQDETHTIPVTNAKLGDNGIMFWARKDDFETTEMAIDIVQNGAVATGKVYPQPQETGVLWDSYLLKLKEFLPTREVLFFLTTA